MSSLYGWPIQVKLDPDGGWQGQFRALADQAGVHCSVIPAESHHKIGLIKRHNAVLRACGGQPVGGDCRGHGLSCDRGLARQEQLGSFSWKATVHGCFWSTTSSSRRTPE